VDNFHRMDIVHALARRLSWHQWNVALYAGLFLVVGGWAWLTQRERPWSSRSRAERYLLLVTVVMLIRSLFRREPD